MPSRRAVIIGALAASASFFGPLRKRRTRLPGFQAAMRRRGLSFSCSAAASR